MEARWGSVAIGPHSSEKSTPSDVHGCQVLLIRCLHDQLIDLTVHGKWDWLLGHKAPKLVTDIFQNTGGRVGDVCMLATLWMR